MNKDKKWKHIRTRPDVHQKVKTATSLAGYDTMQEWLDEKASKDLNNLDEKLKELGQQKYGQKQRNERESKGGLFNI